MKPAVIAVIPARLGSERFAGKVLHPYRGKPLLFYVWSAVSRSRQIDRLVIATDSERIANEAADFGAEVIKTSKKHRTGSDRTAEAAAKIGGEIILNVQADCFGLKAAVLDKVIKRMKDDRTIQCATLARRLVTYKELHDHNQVKVVTATDGRAFWFSRSVIPFCQSLPKKDWLARFGYLGHIGVYFFRRRALREFAAAPQSRLEKAESLEQLRLLELGCDIHVFRTEYRTISIDSRSDLKKLNSLHKREIQYV